MDAFLEEFTFGMWQANCYVLGDRDQGSAVVIDPGQGAVAAVTDALVRNEVRCDKILLTHGHLDHLWSAPELAEAFDAPVFLHPDDTWLWDNPAQVFGPMPLEAIEQNFGLRWDPSQVKLEDLRDGMNITAGGLRFDVLHTPGHTPGSCAFLLSTPAGEQHLVDGDLLLSGDLLFAGSVGRTDLQNGSHDQLLQSIQDQVLPLHDDTVVASGHGPRTTVGRERLNNPFLQGLSSR